MKGVKGPMTGRQAGFAVVAAMAVLAVTAALFPDPTPRIAGAGGGTSAAAIAVLTAFLGSTPIPKVFTSKLLKSECDSAEPTAAIGMAANIPEDVKAAIEEVQRGQFTNNESAAFGGVAAVQAVAYAGIVEMYAEGVRTFAELAQVLRTNAFSKWMLAAEHVRKIFSSVDAWISSFHVKIRRALWLAATLCVPTVIISRIAISLESSSFLPPRIRFCTLQI